MQAAAPPKKASPARGGGCAVRRRRKGALPACGGDVPQSPAGPCPILRRGQRRSTTAIRLPCLPPGSAARLPCIVGRAFTPAGEACGGPKGYWQGRAPHPSVGWRRQLPLQGSLPGGGSPKKPPLQGEVDAPQGADGGVHCRFAAEISCKPWQDLALCFVGDDLCAKSRHFVLCDPKQRMRAAVLASSRKPRNAANPRRRAKSPALHCGRKRALTRKRQPTARPVGGPM